MWTSTNFRTEEQLFDFSEAEMGQHYLMSLIVDDIEFINMVDKMAYWNVEQMIRAKTCPGCGTLICATRNVLAIRRLGDYIFFIPAFDQITVKKLYELSPPRYLEENGAYWLKKSDFKEFRKLVPGIDQMGVIKQISNTEMVKLYKWDTPNKMYGNNLDKGDLNYEELEKQMFFEPLRAQQIASVSELDKKTVVRILEKKLQALEQAESFEITLLQDNDQIISAYLIDEEKTEWKALCKTGSSIELILGGTFMIKPK